MNTTLGGTVPIVYLAVSSYHLLVGRMMAMVVFVASC